MKKQGLVGLFVLLMAGKSFAVNTQFPGEHPPDSSAADIKSTPERYYPPQQPMLNQQGEPVKNPDQPHPYQ